ncbi:MAG: cation:proton antiporter [Bacteroidales bacterium]|nr:cation:proton antiporter [Bacteroidales bacterium]
MTQNILISFGIIILLGFTAQWLAWRIKVPSILFLLLFGIVAGPVAGYLKPDQLLGDVLIPFVSISVAIILFEGGLTLKLSEFKEIGKVVILLISAGVLITWVTTAAAAYWLLGLKLEIAVLLGAVLTVTGPTVISPLLRNIRPKKSVGNILKWESILIDPIGALLAILVFEAILIREIEPAATAILFSLLKTIGLGLLIGGSFAIILTFLMKKYWIPDFLHEAATLSTVITAFLMSDYFQEESGLLATTIMGIVLANQKLIPVKKIKDFKENLTVLMIPILFILLSSRLSLDDISLMSYASIVFLLVIIFLGRPLSVFVSTIGSKLNIREKLFLAWVAPRGIVAAAVSSVFALKLTDLELDQIEYLVPYTFLVIIGTVTIYGLSSPLLAKKLNVSQSDPQGVLMAGAQKWALHLAKELNDHGLKVIFLDTNRNNVKKAVKLGLNAYKESIIAEDIIDALDLEGIGKLLAITPNDEVNSLAVLHFSDIFDVENMYQLTPNSEEEEEKYSPKHLRGRFLFGKGINYTEINKKINEGAGIISTELTQKITVDQQMSKEKDADIPLFIIDPGKKLIPVTSGMKTTVEEGSVLISLSTEKKI